VYSNWTCFNSSVYPRFQLDLVRSYKWAMEAVLAHGGVRVLVYSGVLDVHYNYLALDAWTRSMTWSGAAALRAAPLVPWRPDTDEESSWGEVRQVGQLSVLRVANAGHETCRDLPQVCPAFFSEFVFNRTKPAAKTDDTEALANYSIVLPHGTPIDGAKNAFLCAIIYF
jgi:carboxypeptidase C (cathepsin A)